MTIQWSGVWREFGGLLLRGALEMVYPPLCLLCNANAPSNTFPLCRNCHQELTRDPIPFTLEEITGVALGTDEAGCGRLVRLLKYQGLTSAAGPLGKGMAGELSRTGLALPEAALVPIPMDRVRRRERGFNQAELLARTIARESGLKVRRDLLRKTRVTKSQTRLSAWERRRNLQASMEVRRGTIRPESGVVLVDDVFTTGATILEARRALTSGGIPVLGVVVASRAERGISRKRV